MSRIAKNSIKVDKEINCKFENGHFFAKGKLGEKYNIGSGQNIRNIDIAKKLLSIAKKRSKKVGKKVKIKFVQDRPGHDFRYALNSKKVLKKLNWKSKISLDEGIDEVVQWAKKYKDVLIKEPQNFILRA